MSRELPSGPSILSRAVRRHGAASVLGRLSAEQRAGLAHRWAAWARVEQRPPDSEDWSSWLYLAGRGAGKTRAGAEWLRSRHRRARIRTAIVGPTAADVRDTLVEGQSGVLACCPAHERPHFEPTKRRLTWPDGGVSQLFSAEEPDRLRGPQYHDAWCDELATWANARATWDNLAFGLRLGRVPQVCVTTTPRPTELLKDIMRRAETVVSRGSTMANRANLAPGFLVEIRRRYEGSRLWRQEALGELLDDVEGALWARKWIDDHREAKAPADLVRVVVGVDPPGGRTECGIVAAGSTADGHAHVLADHSLRAGPDEWAAAAVKLYRDRMADAIAVETNFGGDMVAATVRRVDPNIRIIEVHASRGKLVRAEPIAVAYEQGRVHHAGAFVELEDEECTYGGTGESPNRLDAAVWALTHLLDVGAPLSSEGWPGVRDGQFDQDNDDEMGVVLS